MNSVSEIFTELPSQPAIEGRSIAHIADATSSIDREVSRRRFVSHNIVPADSDRARRDNQ